MNYQEQFEKKFYERPPEPPNNSENPEQFSRVLDWQCEYTDWLKEKLTQTLTQVNTVLKNIESIVLFEGQRMSSSGKQTSVNALNNLIKIKKELEGND